MKIKIKKNAHLIYRTRVNIPLGYNFNTKWYDTLQAIAGQEIEVETKYLFINQFNTIPIPNVSKNGLRIMIESVEYVIDDERYGKMKCQYCGNIQKIGAICYKCYKTGYLQIFDKEILDYQQKNNQNKRINNYDRSIY